MIIGQTEVSPLDEMANDARKNTSLEWLRHSANHREIDPRFVIYRTALHNHARHFSTASPLNTPRRSSITLIEEFFRSSLDVLHALDAGARSSALISGVKLSALIGKDETNQRRGGGTKIKTSLGCVD